MTIDIEGLIAEVDEDKSGMIEYDEFMTLLSFQHWLNDYGHFNLMIYKAPKGTNVELSVSF